MDPPTRTAVPPETCLVVMLKAPERSKRRLAAEIGGRAAEAASHLHACALEDAADWRGPVCFAPAEPADEPCLPRHTGDGTRLLILQQGANLGERINHVNATLCGKGLSRQIFIGSDCPALDPEYLREAADCLRRSDVALGPARDGGVVLMASQHAWPDLSGLRWSTAALFDDLCGLCAAHGRSVATLEPRSDIDTLDDLLAARSTLIGAARPARRAFGEWLARQNDLGARP